jgi:predicted dehydrogenase
VEPEDRCGTLGILNDVVRVPTERGNYAAFYGGVAAAIRGEAPPPVDIVDAIRVLAVIEAARDSADRGHVVRF